MFSLGNSQAASFPDANNYEVGVSGVTLLQETYKLNISAMAEGDVSVEGSQSWNFGGEFRPTWIEMITMGNVAYNQGWLDTAITWYQASFL